MNRTDNQHPVAPLRDQLRHLGYDVEGPDCVKLEWLTISEWMLRDLDTPCTVLLATPALRVGDARAVIQIQWRQADDWTQRAHRGNAYIVFNDTGERWELSRWRDYGGDSKATVAALGPKPNGHYELVQAA